MHHDQCCLSRGNKSGWRFMLQKLFMPATLVTCSSFLPSPNLERLQKIESETFTQCSGLGGLELTLKNNLLNFLLSLLNSVVALQDNRCSFSEEYLPEFNLSFRLFDPMQHVISEDQPTCGSCYRKLPRLVVFRYRHILFEERRRVFRQLELNIIERNISSEQLQNYAGNSYDGS